MKISACVNLNDHAWVKLTDEGRKLLIEHYDDLIPKEGRQSEVITTVNSMHYENCGWHRFLLHELMHIFGPNAYNGARNIFQGNIVSLTNPVQLASA
jgi:hypothetical protein